MNTSPKIEDTVLFGKVVTLANPDDIVKATYCADLERLSDVSRLGPAANLFKNSPFFENEVKYIVFDKDTDRNSEFLKQLHLMQDQMLQINDKLSRKDYQKIVSLVKSNASDDELLTSFATLAANTFGGFKVTPEFLANARKLPLVPDMLISENIFNTDDVVTSHEYISKLAKNNILQFHNPIAATLLNTDFLRKTVLETDKSVNTIITELAPLQVSLRLTNTETDLCGLLNTKVPPNTIVLFDIRTASQISHSTLFTFGQGRTGQGARPCPFRKFIIPFLENLRTTVDSTKEIDPNDPNLYLRSRDQL